MKQKITESQALRANKGRRRAAYAKLQQAKILLQGPGTYDAYALQKIHEASRMLRHNLKVDRVLYLRQKRQENGTSGAV